MKLENVEVGKTYRLGQRNMCFFPTGAAVVVKEVGTTSLVTGQFKPDWIVVGLVEKNELFHAKDQQVVEAHELEELS